MTHNSQEMIPKVVARRAMIVIELEISRSCGARFLAFLAPQASFWPFVSASWLLGLAPGDLHHLGVAHLLDVSLRHGVDNEDLTE